MTNMDVANALFLNKKFEDAIFQYELILEDDPHNLLALNNKGYSLSKLKKFEAAIECYDLSLRINPDDKIILVNKINIIEKFLCKIIV